MRLIPAALLLLAAALPASAQQYWDPSVELNMQTEMGPFPYDGMYWHYYQHNWFVSQMNGGPWAYVEPVYVPVYVQQVVIQRFRQPRAVLPDPQMAKRMQANPQLPSDAAVRNYFWGPATTTGVQTGIERAPRR
jgi:hypothetical protein